MSFTDVKDTIGYGDTVMLHIGFDNMVPIITKKGGANQTKFGHVFHDKIIGKKYGSRHQGTKGWLHLLHPSPELWTLSLPHRTQILYTPDISMVIFQLDLKPGSIVVESGTGSGSLSHSIIRTVQPSGHLHTFEFHEERSQKAREEFELHGLSKYVTVVHRDVCAEGFQLEAVADAVFLDLPRPWETIASASAAIKKEGGRICSFSPCIEQVQKTCMALNDHGFTEISTVECLQRNFNMNYAKLQNMNFGDDNISKGDKTDAEKNTTKFLTSPPVVEEKENNSSSIHKQHSETSNKEIETAETETAEKEVEVETSVKQETEIEDTCNQEREGCTPVKQQKTDSSLPKKNKTADPQSSSRYDCAVPAIQMAGHTGFLTFASLFRN